MAEGGKRGERGSGERGQVRYGRAGEAGGTSGRGAPEERDVVVPVGFDLAPTGYTCVLNWTSKSSPLLELL